MAEYRFESIIEAINRAYDNIWLGDLETAKDIIDSNLEEILGQLDPSKFKRTAIELRKVIRKIRKDARERNVKNRRSWVAEMLSKEIEKENLDPIKNIFGVLTIRLSNLKESVSYLINAQEQKNKENFVDKDLKIERIFRRNKMYRYAIQRLPDRWEVRAILDTPVREWDVKRLRDGLKKYDMSLVEVSRTASTGIFELYSKEMYIRLLGQEKLVEILIHTPATKDIKERVSKVTDAIISSLAIIKKND